MIKSNTSHIGFEDTKCPMGVATVLFDSPQARITITLKSWYWGVSMISV